MSHRQRSAVALLVACGAFSAARVEAQNAPSAPLFAIPTESASSEPLPAGVAARVRLTAIDAAQLAKRLGLDVPADSTSFEYLIDRYPQLKTSNERSWLEPTFLIDYDEPVFAELKKEMQDLGEKPGRAQLVAFVNRIVNEQQPRGWDIASIVARKREGDCTEHAVLTAALARLYGIPARVVVGVALISDGSRHAAFGHAWAETFEAGNWVVADAALLGIPQAVRYIPMGVVEDESMGYRMSILGLTPVWIQKVEVLGPKK